MRREKSSLAPHKGSWCAIVDVVEEASSQARQKRANRTSPQPWIVRKLMVFVTLGIIAYSAYVYIARLCVEMILEQRGAGGSRGAGVLLLVIFCILLLWMLWAYAKVVLTPPGFARDHIHQSRRPSFLDLGRPGSFRSEDLDLEMNNTNRSNHRPQPSTSTTHDAAKPDSIAGPSYESIAMRDDQQRTPSTNVTDTPPHRSPATTGNEPEKQSKVTETQKKNSDERPVRVWRRPPTTHVLHPGHRFCAIDEIVKPYRAHHCRTCGTCVLKYDHHCPWIGQCVGARNQKFFLNFNQAAFAYTSYILSTLLAYTIRKASDVDGDIDAQEVVIIALAGLFTIFTGGLLVTHVLLITKGQTTIENMQIKRMKDRESQALNRTLGFCSFLEKRWTKKRWDEEWGKIDKEGNIWWLGSANKEWMEVMGRNPFGWFLPIGRSLNDGLTYPVNPRFSRYGRWRRREEWPPELR